MMPPLEPSPPMAAFTAWMVSTTFRLAYGGSVDLASEPLSDVVDGSGRGEVDHYVAGQALQRSFHCQGEHVVVIQNVACLVNHRETVSVRILRESRYRSLAP
jgi:hypothetical protein